MGITETDREVTEARENVNKLANRGIIHIALVATIFTSGFLLGVATDYYINKHRAENPPRTMQYSPVEQKVLNKTGEDLRR